MSGITAVIDATHHTADAPPEMVVAGLTLIERSLRLVDVCGCDRGVVVADDEHRARLESAVALTHVEIPLNVVVPASGRGIAGALRAAQPAEAFVYVRSSTVYDRGIVDDAVDRSTDGTAEFIDLAEGPADVATLTEESRRIAIDAEAATLSELHESLDHEVDVRVEDEDRWQVRVVDEATADEAAHRLWEGCRKDADGVVSRHLNRHISLAISRTIAASGIKPNHISVVTFALGLLAGLFAASGGFWFFLVGGVIFQANSVIDGVDGELARVRYEFSVLGEWLDTLSDDLSDVFYWTGLGIGAWRTFDVPLEDLGLWGPEIWLWLGGISVVGKLLSMALYYRWLIAKGRGDLLAFEWDFEDEKARRDPGPVLAFLQNARYLTKKDFIVFAIMVLGFVGLQPYMLLAAAPGNFVVFSGVAMQELANRRKRREAGDLVAD